MGDVLKRGSLTYFASGASTSRVGDSERYEFGKNWKRFAAGLTELQLEEAASSLKRMLAAPIAGRTFLDAGCGSGLFSLAAVRLGAARVHAFDVDLESVACAQSLKDRYAPHESAWTIERGDLLDGQYLRDVGPWDVVYCWGVAHHTGALWNALDNLRHVVAPRGTLFLAVYNDQGSWSKRWARIKRLHNSGRLGRALTWAMCFPYFVGGAFAKDVLSGRNPRSRYTEYYRRRGMSRFADLRDWLGGYPFEVAKPEQLLDFYRSHGFNLVRLKTCGGSLGCNEYVFERDAHVTERASLTAHFAPDPQTR